MATSRKRDRIREERIAMTIVVDAYDAEEQAMGWYDHLESQLRFPFVARCIRKRAISPLQVNDEVEVVGMPPEEECESEMFVTIRWRNHKFAVPLAQLRPIGNDAPGTREAIEDWHYWDAMGYRFR